MRVHTCVSTAGIPSVLEDVGDVPLELAETVGGQPVVLGHGVELGGEHESCRGRDTQQSTWKTCRRSGSRPWTFTDAQTQSSTQSS